MEIQHRYYMKKLVVTLLLFLLILSGSTQVFFNDLNANASSIIFSEDIIFVGGSSEGNYSSIHEAIENASNHTTIYVYQGTYNETLIVNKSIQLTGQDTLHTVISSDKIGTVITVISDSVVISNFTIKNSGSSVNDSGVHIKSSNVTITHMLITRNQNGIRCENASDIQILDNEITFSLQDGNGILLDCIKDTVIFNNTITMQKANGIILQSLSTENSIVKNTIENNNQYGLYIRHSSSDNLIYNNTFRSNSIANAYDNCTNMWDKGYPIGGNYWDDYDGSDEFYGPHQNLNGSDMIGDSPYNIQPAGKNNDSFPLIDTTPQIIVDDDFLDIIAGWNHIRFKSIQTAINHADSYDVIKVKNGTYKEHLFIDKPLSIIASDGEDVIVDGKKSDSVLIVNASQVRINGLIIRNSGNATTNSAIAIFAESTIIKECLIKENNWGICIYSSNNDISNNRISNNQNGGICISEGSMNHLFGNEISFDKPVGILLLSNATNHTVIEGNRIYNINGDGLKVVNSSNNMIIGNNITMNSGNGIILEDQSFFNEIQENTISSNLMDGIHLQELNQVTYPTIIQDNTIQLQHGSGIYLQDSKNCTIISNMILDNTIGISLQNAARNKMVLNDIIDNQQFGLDLNNSMENHIYNNNIINDEDSTVANARDNGQNFWNGSYGIGGNYWDGYDGIDVYHGPEQQKIGRDGIFDSSYYIMTNEDYYPYVFPDGWDHRLCIESILCGSCGTIGHRDFNFIKGLSVNIVNYGQNPTKADLVVTVNELFINNSLLSRMYPIKKSYELFIESEDQMFITIMTDDSLWKGRFFRVGMAEITIDLEIVSWKGYAFCYRSFFFLLNEEFQ